MEYSEVDPSSSPQWTKPYIYLGNRLLATIEPSGNSEFVSYQHPDRLGTRLITNNQNASTIEQVHLPFGNALDAESSGATKRRFTSYDRSSVTGLDYAVNRHYDPLQGRFTTVDPIGASASNISDPQSFNLYAYCGNDPVNRVDPNGLFWGFLKKVFGFIGKVVNVINKVIKWVVVALVVAAAVIAVVVNPAAGLAFLGWVLGHAAGVLGFAEGAAIPTSTIIGSAVFAGLETVGSIANYFQGRKEDKKDKRNILSTSLILELIKANNRSGLDHALILCQIYQESHPAGQATGTFNADARVGSHRGLMQVSPEAAKAGGLGNGIGNGSKKVRYKTDKELGNLNPDYINSIYDPATNISVGTTYLKKDIDLLGGDVKKALENYGTGPGYADKLQGCADKVNAGDIIGGLETIYPQ